MALSGTVNTSAYDGRYVQLKWTATQDVASNTSTVSWTLKGAGTGGVTWYMAGPFKVTVNGVEKVIDTRIQLRDGTTVGSGSTKISHNNDGTKSFSISVNAAIYSSSYNKSGSGTFTLNTIPRATTPTFSASSVNMGSSVTITLPRATSAFTHRLTYAFGSLTNQTSGIANYSSAGASTTFTPPLTLADQVPKATSGTCTVTCKTYNGSTLIGTKTATLKLNVPSSVKPTISNVSISEATADLATKFEAYVQNKSTLAVRITAAGSYSSTISTYETTIQDVKYNKASFTSSVITASGSITISTTVKDSRGRTASVSNTITVVAYSPPVISAMEPYRIDHYGVRDEEGTRIGIDANYSISPVNNRNDKTYTIKYKLSGSSSEFVTVDSGTGQYSYSDTMAFTTGPDISIDNAYVVRFEISDYFTTVAYEYEIPTARPLMDFRSTGKGIEFGAVSNEDVFGVDMPAKFRQNVNVEGEFSASNIKFGMSYLTPTANEITTKEIIFDEPFENVPYVFITPRATVPGRTVVGMSVDNISETGFTVYVLRTNGSNTYFDWLAIS